MISLEIWKHMQLYYNAKCNKKKIHIFITNNDSNPKVAACWSKTKQNNNYISVPFQASTKMKIIFTYHISSPLRIIVIL